MEMKDRKFASIALIVVLIVAMLGVGIWYVMKPKTNGENNITTNENAKDKDINVEYSASDLDSSWDEATAVNIIFSNTGITSSDASSASVQDNIVTITAAGEYHLTGENSDAQVIVETDKSNKVKLVLDNLNLSCKTSSPIFVKQADKVIITLADGSTNTISDGNSYELNEEEEPNATIFSKEDLAINGTGTLNVISNYEDAIASKDDLKIISGNINIKANDDGLRGKDSLVIKEGTINIKANGDGIKSTNEDSEDVGYIVIENGNITIDSAKDAIHAESNLQIKDGTIKISSGDDGIHANESLVIEGGSINIEKSYEGLEASNITINNGKIYVVASDDGINVAGGNDGSSMNGRPGQNNMNTSSNSSHMLIINGGYIYVNATGDGLDSNGSAYMNGGTVIVNGPTNNGNGALDYDGTFEVNGGLLIAAGSSGMLQTSSNNSKINCISVTFDTAQEAEKLISLQDSSNNEIVTFSPSKTYQSVVICSSDIKNGETYKVYSGGSSTKSKTDGLYENGGYSNGSIVTELTVNSTVTTYGSSGMGNGQGGMRPGGNMMDRNQSGDNMQGGNMMDRNQSGDNMQDRNNMMNQNQRSGNMQDDSNMMNKNKNGEKSQNGNMMKGNQKR